MTQVTEPFPIFYDDDGSPLENGMIYIGVANQDPRANPVTVYVDDALTAPIAQPIRTLGGRPAYQGAPVNLYISQGAYSIAVQNKYGTPIVSDDNVTSDFVTRIELAAPSGASLVGYTQGGTGASARTVQAKLREFVSVKDFGAVGDGVTNDTAAIASAIAQAIASGQQIYVPAGTYICNGLGTLASGRLSMFGEGKLKASLADQTLCAPVSSVEVNGLTFEGYMIGFNFNGVAAGADITFNNVSVIDCGKITTAGGRADFQGFIHAGTSANAINSLRVTDCRFVGDDFGICYRSGFASAIVSNCEFRTMRRMAVMLGADNSGDWTIFESVDVNNCKFFGTVSDDANENEIHCVLAYGDFVSLTDCYSDECRDIHASIHDSEAIYVRANYSNVSGNYVKNGARGDGCISVKGGDRAIVSNNTVEVEAAWAALYGTPSGIYCEGGTSQGRAIVEANQVYGTLDRGILISGCGRAADNRVEGVFTFGIFGQLDASTGGAGGNVDFEIQDNTIIESGTGTAGICARVSDGQTANLVNITGNTVRLTSSGTLVSAFQAEANRVSAGNRNTISHLVVSDNIWLARTGATMNGTLVACDLGSGATGGLVSRVTYKDNDSDFADNVFRTTAVSTGDIGTFYVSGGLNTNTANRLLSNVTVATTGNCRNVKGNRASEAAGTATITAAATSVTVAMGLQDTLRPTNLRAIQVTPTSDNGSATHWWVSNLTGDNFNINCDVAPGGDFTFAWQAVNLYY